MIQVPSDDDQTTNLITTRRAGSPLPCDEGALAVPPASSQPKRARANSHIASPSPKLEQLQPADEQLSTGRPRASTFTHAGGTRRRLPIAGVSKVLQDATRVAEALGKAQRARHDEEDKRMGVLRAELSPREPVTTPDSLQADTLSSIAAEESARELFEETSVESLQAGDADLAVEPRRFLYIDDMNEEEEVGEVDGFSGEAADSGQWEGSHGELDGEVAQQLQQVEEELLAEEVSAMCAERCYALLQKDWTEAERIQSDLWKKGITLDDTKGSWASPRGTTRGSYKPPDTFPPLLKGQSPASPRLSKKIDAEAYRKLLGRSPERDDPHVKVVADRMMLEEECTVTYLSNTTKKEKAKAGAKFSSRSRTPQGRASTRGPLTTDGLSPDPDSPTLTAPVSLRELRPGERLYFSGAARENLRQAKLKQERALKAQEEVSMNRSPVITKAAKSVTQDFATRQADWAEKVKASREAAKQRVQLESDQEQAASAKTGQTLSKRSEKLSRRSDAGPVKSWTERFERHVQARSIPPPDASSFTPNITKAASKLPRKGSACDRLYADGISRVVRQEARANQAAEQDLFDVRTGQPLYTPVLAASQPGSVRRSERSASASIVSSPPRSPPSQVRGSVIFTRAVAKKTEVDADSVVHRLLSCGQQAERRRQLKENEYAADATATFKPKLTKASEEIAARMERRPLYETAPKEQHGGIQHGSVLFTKHGSGASQAGSTAGSVYGSVSRSRHGNGNGQEESFTQRSAMHEQQRRVRVERLRQMKQETELSACTFAPSICETSKSIFKKSSVRQKQQQASGGADSCSAASSHEQALSRRSSSASGPFDESYDYLQQLDQEEDAAYLHQPPAPGFPRGAGALFEDSAAFFERYHSDEGEDDSAAASLPGGVQCSWPASRDRSPQHELIRDLTAANGVIYDEPRRALGTYDPVTFVAADKCTSSSLPSDSDNAFESSDDANNEPLPPRPVFSKSLDASYAQNAQNALLNWRRLSSKLDDDA